MSLTFVVADAHGRYDLIHGLLHQEGLVDSEGGRLNGEVTVIQIGDLCNCVSTSIEDDKVCLGFAPEWFDVYLVGNHEHPYFRGPHFSGFWRDTEIERVLLLLNDRGLIQAAYAADGILISHAGLNREFLASLPEEVDATEIAIAANNTWFANKTSPLFSNIGQARGGWTRYGGILWADWSEPKVRGLRQLVGHTVGEEIRKRYQAICIDLGAGKGRTRIAGAWIRDGLIETVIYGKEIAV